MGVTPDSHDGPSDEEETQYQDRGPGGDNDGEPVVEGALRRVTNTLRFFVASTVRQILQIKNPPVGFADADLSGIVDGQVLGYNATSKQLEPITVSGSGDGGISEAQHESLRQLIHFVEEGPGHGFGDYTKEVDRVGAFESESRWYDSGVLLLKRTTGLTGSGTVVKPNPIEYRMYDTDGTTVVQKIVETITYNGVFEFSRSGTVS